MGSVGTLTEGKPDGKPDGTPADGMPVGMLLGMPGVGTFSETAPDTPPETETAPEITPEAIPDGKPVGTLGSVGTFCEGKPDGKAAEGMFNEATVKDGIAVGAAIVGRLEGTPGDGRANEGIGTGRVITDIPEEKTSDGRGNEGSAAEGPVVGSPNDERPFDGIFTEESKVGRAIVDRDGSFTEESKVGTANVDRDGNFTEGRPSPGRAIVSVGRSVVGGLTAERSLERLNEGGPVGVRPGVGRFKLGVVRRPFVGRLGTVGGLREGML